MKPIAAPHEYHKSPRKEQRQDRCGIQVMWLLVKAGNGLLHNGFGLRGLNSQAPQHRHNRELNLYNHFTNSYIQRLWGAYLCSHCPGSVLSCLRDMRRKAKSDTPAAFSEAQQASQLQLLRIVENAVWHFALSVKIPLIEFCLCSFGSRL